MALQIFLRLGHDGRVPARYVGSVIVIVVFLLGFRRFGIWLLVSLGTMGLWMPLLAAVVTSYVLTFLFVVLILCVSLIT